MRSLTVSHIVLAALWVVNTVPMGTAKEIVLSVFTELVQGVIFAELVLYGDQRAKPAGKTE